MPVAQRQPSRVEQTRLDTSLLPDDQDLAVRSMGHLRPSDRRADPELGARLSSLAEAARQDAGAVASVAGPDHGEPTQRRDRDRRRELVALGVHVDLEHLADRSPASDPAAIDGRAAAIGRRTPSPEKAVALPTPDRHGALSGPGDRGIVVDVRDTAEVERLLGGRLETIHAQAIHRTQTRSPPPHAEVEIDRSPHEREKQVTVGVEGHGRGDRLGEIGLGEDLRWAFRDRLSGQ